MKLIKQTFIALLLTGMSIFSTASNSQSTNALTLSRAREAALTNISSINTFNRLKEKTIIEAAKVLSQFGEKIASGNISKENLKLISTLAKIPLPNLQLFDKDAILTTGINFNTIQPIILSSITGEAIKPCTQITCRVQAIPPNTAVKTALENTKPIPGHILIKGKRVPATYIVSVTALYEGSKCITRYINGRQYKFCY